MPTRTYFPTVPLAELISKGMAPQTNPLNPVILVVDDERVIADTLGVILNRSGFTAMVAYDATTAFEMAKLVPPDLLLTDVVMPGMSGVDLAVAVRHAIPTCKVLLFSGQAATADLLGTAADTDFTVLSKPLHPTDLLAKLSQTLQLPAFLNETWETRRSPLTPAFA